MNFETIYKTYWQKVFRLCMGYVNDIDAAKDLSQETFIKISKQLPKFELSLGIEDEILETNIEKDIQFLYQCILE